MCPSPLLPHAISAQNCAEFEVKHKSNSSWTHSNPGTWKLVVILKWKTDRLAANISRARTQLKSGTVCTVLLGTQFYAFQIQNQKRFLGIAAWGVRFRENLVTRNLELNLEDKRRAENQICFQKADFLSSLVQMLFQEFKTRVSWRIPCQEFSELSGSRGTAQCSKNPKLNPKPRQISTSV